jgi:hypothetical protein
MNRIDKKEILRLSGRKAEGSCQIKMGIARLLLEGMRPHSSHRHLPSVDEPFLSFIRKLRKDPVNPVNPV